MIGLHWHPFRQQVCLIRLMLKHLCQHCLQGYLPQTSFSCESPLLRAVPKRPHSMCASFSSNFTTHCVLALHRARLLLDVISIKHATAKLSSANSKGRMSKRTIQMGGHMHLHERTTLESADIQFRNWF